MWQDGHDGENTKQNTSDMTAFVQNLLQQMVTNQVIESDFLSETMILSVMLAFCIYIVRDTYICFLNLVVLDEMGNRIDELEQSINDLRAEMGQEGSPSPSAPLKAKDETKSAQDS
ncbi:heat shock factor binding protein [Striga asiatica]|uniref:Heat shock factor binding protein n=1 Tax=Striga asiatica TaxID=4170 RepID=A0A5A7RIA7_STRAF|nr:heat shock factor binding protein [Striga asiatica]